jgi:hypothetical protein
MRPANHATDRERRGADDRVLDATVTQQLDDVA